MMIVVDEVSGMGGVWAGNEEEERDNGGESHRL